jgi:hypothetical protein
LFIRHLRCPLRSPLGVSVCLVTSLLDAPCPVVSR